MEIARPRLRTRRRVVDPGYAGRVDRIEDAEARQARSLANRKIGFLGHAVVYGCSGLLLVVVTGPFVAVIVLLAWGIGLAAHGFFFVAAPLLRTRWTADVRVRAAHHVLESRQELGGRHTRSLEVLSASVAHEIRNPITAARSLVAQIGEDPAAPENAEYARVAVAELDRVERSISHLLRFARDEEVVVSEITLADVVEASLPAFDARIAKGGVEVVRRMDSFGAVRADPEKLRRVLANLVGNALDAFEEGRTPAPRLELSLGENLAGTEVWLRVRDNGPGIAPERLAKIFTPFHTSKRTGTGLGLALSKKVVEAHGGTLEVKSQLGGGTDMTVVLPKGGAVS
jgi:signal transduction histidine kinase